MDYWLKMSSQLENAGRGAGTELSSFGTRASMFSRSLHDVLSSAIALDARSFVTYSFESNIPIDPTVIAYPNDYGHPYFLLVADEEGVLHFRNTKSGPPVNLGSLRVHPNHAILDAKFRPGCSNLQCITASGDMTCALVDCSTQQKVTSFVGHLQNVRCLSWQKDTQNNVFISGGRDGHCMLWDLRSGVFYGNHYPVAYLVNAHTDFVPRQRIPYRRLFREAPGKYSVNVEKLNAVYTALPDDPTTHRASITDIVFQTSYTFLTSGTADSSIRLWDLRKLKPSSEKPQSVLTLKSDSGLPFTSLALDASRTNLYAACRDGIVYRFDVGPRMHEQPTAQYAGAVISSFYTKCTLSQDGELLGCGSAGGKGYVFRTRQPEEAPVVLNSATEDEVTEVAFNHWDPYQVVTASTRILVWDAGVNANRSSPNIVAGLAEKDPRGLEERTPKRPSRDRTPGTADPRTPTVSSWVRRPSSRENDGSPTRAVGLSPRPNSSLVLKTPNSQVVPLRRKKRLRNLTLSPYLKARRKPPSPSSKT
ncbi:denticleless protein homolog A-like [Paramacrobiotus metropolitanus]|uniref:denticleless protein homolog A-like n=1 Tax=Paramacrobiotus metropolitanus TaxID=2943436 RepID=UPI002445FA97|nr:denticleless protein homolog A-like [Paramacrobiotus metropolitanus]